MICAINTATQTVTQNKNVTFQACQSTSCNEQLQNNKVKLFFPGVYTVQWSVTGYAINRGMVRFQVNAEKNAIVSCEASAQVEENHLVTLTSAPVIIVHQNQNVPLTLSLQNRGSAMILSNAVLTVRKVY